MCTHMTSKNISVTKEVYDKLMKIKRENESFSESFLRLLKVQKANMEKSFGAWNLTEKEKKGIWEDITEQTGKKWERSEHNELN